MRRARVWFRIVVFAAPAFLALAGAARAQAQTPSAFPTRAIQMVVPYPAGGSADVLARVIAEAAARDLGQPIVIENRAGAGGAIGAQQVARARPDGHTLVVASTPHAIMPALDKTLQYDLQRDLAPVFGITSVPQVIVVNGKSGVRSFAELEALARTTPKGLNVGNAGSGTLSHLTLALILRSRKIEATQVSYRGLAPIAQAILGNQIHFAVINVPDALEATRAGEMRALALTADQRLAVLPDVPTVVELGVPEAVAFSWTAYLAPAGTPPAVIDRLAAGFAKAMADPAVQDRLGKLHVTLRPMPPAQLAAHLQSELDRWRRVVEQNQIKAENRRGCATV